MLAQEAACALGLERVLLVPVGQAPHRKLEGDPGREARLELVRAAAADDELLEASDLEVRRDGASYTFRTLELLRDERPRDELTFLVGADAGAALESWREPRRLLELARLGIAARPGAPADEALSAVARLGGEGRASVVEMPELGISSTEIRRRVAAGEPIRYLVPDAVAGLIAERSLYGAGGAGA